MIYIDGQVFQTQTWNRGMGKYSFELLKSAALNADFRENITMVFSSLLEIEPERLDLIHEAIPNLEVLYLPLKTTNHTNYFEVRDENKRVLNEVIGSGDRYFIPSIFEGDVVSVFPDESIKMAILYDLIPHLFYDTYLRHNEVARHNYYNRYATLFEADMLFAISETTRNDAVVHLGMDSARVFNVNGASISMTKTTIKPQSNTLDKFIVSPSGDDNRKNNIRMAEAFRLFNLRHNNKYKLIITSNFRDSVKEGIIAISNDIIFVGNVPEPELRWYYKNAQSLLFVPEYEGLGLPVLEAVEVGIPIVCSRIGVFEEMNNGVGFNFVDYDSIDSIAEGLCTVVDNRKYDTESYAKVSEKYTWQKSAELFLSVFFEAKSFKKPQNRTKVAVVGPMPGGKSAIGKVVELCHFAMSQKYDVTYYFEIPADDIPAARLSYIHNVPGQSRDVSEFTIVESQKYEKIVYHLGSSTYHLKTILSALAVPGAVFMHDTDFEAVYKCLTTEMLICKERYVIEEQLSKKVDSNKYAKFICTIANSASGIYVHSKYAKDLVDSTLVQSEKDKNKIIVSNLPIGVNLYPNNMRSKKIIVAVAGIIHHSKGLNVLLQILQDQRFSDVEFRIYGYNYATQGNQLEEIRKFPNARIMVNLSDLKYREENQKAHILLNYRGYYHGETSYSTLEAMREGVVPIVRGIGWFSEIEDSACLKARDEEHAVELLAELVSDPEKIQKISKCSFEYANKFTPAQYIDNI